MTETRSLADELLAQLAERQAVSAEERSRLVAEREAREKEDAKRAAESMATYRRDRCLAVLPPKLRKAMSADSLDASWPAAQAALKWWDKTTTRAFLLRGGIGVGKTAAAGLVVRDAAASLARISGSHEHRVSWHRPGDFVSAVLHQYDAQAPKLGTNLVVVDDVGRETKSDFEEALCTFLDDYEARLLMTTNLTKEEFRSRYGERVRDRLLECAAAVTIEGGSRRRQAGDF